MTGDTSQGWYHLISKLIAEVTGHKAVMLSARRYAHRDRRDAVSMSPDKDYAEQVGLTY